eukprot:2339376-Rhodomonas_salina.1
MQALSSLKHVIPTFKAATWTLSPLSLSHTHVGGPWLLTPLLFAARTSHPTPTPTHPHTHPHISLSLAPPFPPIIACVSSARSRFLVPRCRLAVVSSVLLSPILQTRRPQTEGLRCPHTSRGCDVLIPRYSGPLGESKRTRR